MSPSDQECLDYLRDNFRSIWWKYKLQPKMAIGSPLDRPKVRKDMCAPRDCRTLWNWKGSWFLMFHQTSVESMELILRDGPVPQSCRTGFSGELQPEAFYASCVPLVNGYEIFMPHLVGKEFATVGVLVPCSVAIKRFLFHPTWPVLQFALQPGDWDAVCHVPESCLRNFRTDRKLLARADSWRREREMEGLV